VTAVFRLVVRAEARGALQDRHGLVTCAPQLTMQLDGGWAVDRAYSLCSSQHDPPSLERDDRRLF